MLNWSVALPGERRSKHFLPLPYVSVSFSSFENNKIVRDSENITCKTYRIMVYKTLLTLQFYGVRYTVFLNSRQNEKQNGQFEVQPRPTCRRPPWRPSRTKKLTSFAFSADSPPMPLLPRQKKNHNSVTSRIDNEKRQNPTIGFQSQLGTGAAYQRIGKNQ